MGRKPIDITGNRYGRLVVVRRDVESGSGSGVHASWLCKCDCGKKTIVTRENLVRGFSRSCGCLRHDLLVEKMTTHGESRKRLHGIWYKMVRRCNNKNSSGYKYYGGRGIALTDEWRDYWTFRKWAIENSYNDGLEIDRINPNGNYEPSNCRWVDKKQNANNKRSNLYVEHQGKIYTVAELSEKTGIKYNKLYHLVRKSPEGAVIGENIKIKIVPDRWGL